MADVKSAAQWIGRLLAEEVKYLAKVGDKVRELQDELEWMQCFLRDADANQLDNSIARKWVGRIRELAYEAEDTVESFLVSNSRGGHDWLRKARKYSRMFWKVIALHKIGNKIDALKNKMSSLTAKLQTYGINFKLGDSSSWISKANHTTYFTFKQEELIKGREVDLNELLDQLVHVEVTNIVGSPQPSSSNTGQVMSWPKAERETRVFSICGEGGIGKTFLAYEIFRNPKIRRSYDAFAWASISKPCQISAVQQELLSSLTSKSREQIAEMADEELKDELRKVQRRKKCFIVLDGFWEEDLWDRLKEAFPITCHRSKSKILLTTRLEKVAKHIDPQVVIHKLELLDGNQSELLLATKFSGDLRDISDDDKKIRNDLKMKMLRLCGGLPLAIAVLGGVLAKQSTTDDWKKLEKNLSSYSIDKEEKSWDIILDLSYYELPYQLKPCFLYLSYFPTNLEITTTKLSRLWEAEGLVSSGDNEESDETLEDVAESCLAELVERSLVQVASRDLTGRAKTCRLHDVMQKRWTDKALRADWLRFVKIGEKSDQPSDSSNKSLKSSRLASKKNSRRVAIYCTEKLDKLPNDFRRASYIRSLLFFNTLEKNDFLIPLQKKALKSTFNRYKLLRVLDIENIGLHSLPSDVGYLIHLRYLSLRGSWVSKLPYSIKHLSCLQTLDLRVLSFVSLKIPNVLWRLERLVHLYLPARPFIHQNEATGLRLKGLSNLETLSNFSNKCNADDVCTLTKLREFSSCDYLSACESIEPLLRSPSSELVHLDYISLRLYGRFLNTSTYDLKSCKALRKLWVKEKISVSISSGMFPENLNKLTFSGSEFLEDPMPVFEKLPHLKQLSLEHGSYKGTHMSCSGGGFRELCYLNVEGLENLKEWTVKEEAMPKLFSLEINGCHKLQMIPDGLRFVKSLQELIISYMPLSFYRDWTPMKSLREWHEYWKVEHVLRIDISKVLDIKKQIPIYQGPSP